MQSVANQHENELSHLPKDYTINMALDNNDLIRYCIFPFNTMRMKLFLYKCLHKAPDKFRIVDYEMDLYPTISILEYHDEMIIYTRRTYKPNDERAYYQTYYGKAINQKYTSHGKHLVRDYNLTTYNYGGITVFRELL